MSVKQSPPCYSIGRDQRQRQPANDNLGPGSYDPALQRSSDLKYS